MKNEISLSKFLIRYFEIRNVNILNMTHNDVKELLPQLKRASFEYVKKNSELLTDGQVIMVKDCCGKVIPYFCPKLINKEELIVDIEVIEDNLEKKSKEKIPRLTKEEMKNLTNWQLIQLLKKYRKNLISCYDVYREMKIRGINVHKKEEKRRKKVIYEEC